ncbi:MAG: tRNA threonylcarbamoyladenosine dehydratase [Corallococcus sp.]|nr:tRNA threonylcarbamoyladenosine dehydratase [Corallococcus sp.]
MANCITQNIFQREENLIGADNLKMLSQKHVAVFGLGGVGSYAAEALVRAGIGKLTLVDCDVIDVTNINRQLFADISTVGKYKTDVAKKRFADINPQAEIICVNKFFFSENADAFDFGNFDYVIDAIDTVSSKLALITKCYATSTPVVSCMGTGNKLHPEMFEIADISQTQICPLAKVMRRELKKAGINKLTVVYSKEPPIKPQNQTNENGRHIPASISFAPPVAGLLLASAAVNVLLNDK